MRIIIVLILLLANLLAEYKLDGAHAQANFQVKHLGILSLNGNFDNFSTSVDFDEENKLVALNGKVMVDSINTRNGKRDKHLKDKDFFHAKKHPKLTFKMTAYEGDATAGEVTGDLTMRGVTKKVVLQANFSKLTKNSRGQNVKAVSLAGSVNRKDFNIGKKYANVTISENVDIDIAFEVIKK